MSEPAESCERGAKNNQSEQGQPRTAGKHQPSGWESTSRITRYQRQRWWDVALMGFWGGAVVAIAWPAIASGLTKPELLAPLNYGFRIILSILVLGGFFAHFARGRWAGFLGIKHFKAYPPLWVSVAIGLVVVLICNVLSEALDHLFAPKGTFVGNATRLMKDHFWELLLAVFMATTIVTMYFLCRKEPSTRNHTTIYLPGPDTSRTGESLDSVKKLFNWIQDDQPVGHPDDDYFSHKHVARRIAQRLSTPNAKAPTITLVGDKGTGKSTILALVEFYLREKALLDQSIALIKVTLWPFETADAAASGILKALSEELSKHVNTVAITTIGKQYVQAISAASLNLGILTSFFEGTSSPDDVIKRIESIVAAIDLRLVLWIEDLERFAGAGRLSIDGKNEDKLGSIRAMLYLLDKSQHISVLLSDATLSSAFDENKISRYVEHVPFIHPLKATAMLSDFQQALSIRHEDTDHSPYGNTASDLVSESLLRDVAVLLRTPRTFKDALRSAEEVWTDLHGEINLADVILITSIKVSQPALFRLIDEEIGTFRHGNLTWGDVTGATGYVDPVQSRVSDWFRELQAPVAKSSVVEILYDLFARTKARSSVDGPAPPRFQRLRDNSHTDYWRRYAAVARPSSEESDQGALKSIQAWRAETNNSKRSLEELIDRILDSARQPQIIHFFECFTSSEKERLFVDVLCRLNNSRAAEVNEISSLGELAGLDKIIELIIPPKSWPRSANDPWYEIAVGAADFSLRLSHLVHNNVDLSTFCGRSG